MTDESKTKIMICTCNHKYQDSVYGKYYRLHNEAKSKSAGSKSWTCTVCGNKK